MRITHASIGFKTLDTNMFMWCPTSSIMDRVFGAARWIFKYTTHHFYHCMHGLSINVLKKFRKTPSNASNFPKGFRRSHFWTSMMSYSWNFFDSCANSNRKITKLIYVLICKKEEQNGHTKNGVKKSDFLDRKKSDMWIHNVSCICIFWVYQIKQKYAI